MQKCIYFICISLWTPPRGQWYVKKILNKYIEIKFIGSYKGLSYESILLFLIFD